MNVNFSNERTKCLSHWTGHPRRMNKQTNPRLVECRQISIALRFVQFLVPFIVIEEPPLPPRKSESDFQFEAREIKPVELKRGWLKGTVMNAFPSPFTIGPVSLRRVSSLCNARGGCVFQPCTWIQFGHKLTGHWACLCTFGGTSWQWAPVTRVLRHTFEIIS